MGWSYSRKPSNSDLDQVRFLVQDTNKNDQLLQDEEIEFLISEEGNPYMAAMRAAEVIAANFARFCDEAVGQVRISLSQRYEHYKDLAERLRRKAAIKTAMPFAGALDISQKEAVEDNDDRVSPAFTRDTHDIRKLDPNEYTGREIQEAIQEEESP